MYLGFETIPQTVAEKNCRSNSKIMCWISFEICYEILTQTKGLGPVQKLADHSVK